ncbi:MAG: Lrp/AsnC ligand binding domain-containing protein [Promethearchaeota archaeon]
MEIQLVSFIKVHIGQKGAFLNALKQIEEIVRVQSITGDYDILIEINVAQSEDLVATFESIDKIPGLLGIQSHFVLEEWQK